MNISAIDKILISVENVENDVVILDFLKEMIEKEKDGLYSYRSIYRKKISKYCKYWDENNEI